MDYLNYNYATSTKQNHESKSKGNLKINLKKMIENNIKPIKSWKQDNLEQNDLTIFMVIFIPFVLLNTHWTSFTKKIILLALFMSIILGYTLKYIHIVTHSPRLQPTVAFGAAPLVLPIQITRKETARNGARSRNASLCR